MSLEKIDAVVVEIDQILTDNSFTDIEKMLIVLEMSMLVPDMADETRGYRKEVRALYYAEESGVV